MEPSLEPNSKQENITSTVLFFSDETKKERERERERVYTLIILVLIISANEQRLYRGTREYRNSSHEAHNRMFNSKNSHHPSSIHVDMRILRRVPRFHSQLRLCANNPEFLRGSRSSCRSNDKDRYRFGLRRFEYRDSVKKKRKEGREMRNKSLLIFMEKREF